MGSMPPLKPKHSFKLQGLASSKTPYLSTPSSLIPNNTTRYSYNDTDPVRTTTNGGVELPLGAEYGTQQTEVKPVPFLPQRSHIPGSHRVFTVNQTDRGNSDSPPIPKRQCLPSRARGQLQSHLIGHHHGGSGMLSAPQLRPDIVCFDYPTAPMVREGSSYPEEGYDVSDLWLLGLIFLFSPGCNQKQWATPNFILP